MTEPGPKLPHLSWNAALVLKALVEGHRYGFDIIGVTRLRSGSVYPLLRRFESSRLVESLWENESAAHAEGRPPRRYYQATELGRTALSAALERIMAQQRLFGLASGETGGT